METVLTDITGYLGEWFDNGFDSGVPRPVINLLEEAYSLAVAELSKM